MKVLFRFLLILACTLTLPLGFTGCGPSYMSEDEAMETEEDTAAEEAQESENE
jgi:hypothetical protein